eukprot:Selendium_serpulae@DN6511_c3_g1_i1.p1
MSVRLSIRWSLPVWLASGVESGRKVCVPVTREGPGIWRSKGTYRLLNTDHNYGLLFDGTANPLKSEKYSVSVRKWGSLDNFKRFEVEILSSLEKKHTLRFTDVRDMNTTLYTTIASEPHSNTGSGGVRYQLRPTPNESECATFEIRKSAAVDEFGTHALIVTAEHNGKMVVLSIDEATTSNYGTVYMREVATNDDLSGWDYFYLSKNVDLGNCHAELTSNRNDTFYIYNQDMKAVVVPFVNQTWQTGVTYNWGNKSRWNVKEKNLRWWQLINNSKYAKDRYKAYTDGTEMTQSDSGGGTLASGYSHNQTTVDLQCLFPDETDNWVVLRQRHREHNIGVVDGGVRLRCN